MWFPLDDVLYSAGPLSVLNYLDISLKRGIIVKDGRVIEVLREVDTIVFDKTGTLTEEQPCLKKIHTCGQYSESELLIFTAAAEQKQTHPIAKAILKVAREHQIEFLKVQNISYEIGYGLKASVDNKIIYVGSKRFMEKSSFAFPETMQKQQQHCDEAGHSLIYVAIDEIIAGAFELQAKIRPGYQDVIHKLKQRGINIYIMSGDHEKPTKALAKEFGIENYFAQVLPEEKAGLVEELQNTGKTVCFIGDGINDSIALKKSQVSISLSGASSIATDTAQIILMDKQPDQLIQLLDLAQNLKRDMNNILISGIIPSVAIIGGVFLIHLRIPFAIACYMTGMTAGVSNALWPSIKEYIFSKPQEKRKGINVHKQS
ncbi:heavy metal translocating P-type ATPase [Candidatus Magnetomorum sp. HK-1]|nr:heavy metal translocating P-type ATPase [Candidatus Magnetomorum sp. HK-1]